MSADEARDVVADVWGVAAESEQEFIATPDPWSALVRWLRVVCADRVRVWRREVSVDPTLLVTRAGGGSDLEPAERPQAEFGEWLTRISSRLPQKERLAFELRYLQRYSYVEVAATLRCSQPAARKAVSRGLRKCATWPKSLPRRVGMMSMKPVSSEPCVMAGFSHVTSDPVGVLVMGTC